MLKHPATLDRRTLLGGAAGMAAAWSIMPTLQSAYAAQDAPVAGGVLTFGNSKPAEPAHATLWRTSTNYVWNTRVQGALPYQYQRPVRPAFERVWLNDEGTE